MGNLSRRIQQADVAQRKEQGSSEAKVEGSSPSVSARPLAVAVREEIKQQFPDAIDKQVEEWTNAIILKHKERLDYNAAYQRDLRTIKRLGLNCTVKEWREKNDKVS